MSKFEVGRVYKTRDGRDARVICVDSAVPKYPIIALMKDGELEAVSSHTRDGKFVFTGIENINDLMLPAPKVWVVAAVEDGVLFHSVTAHDKFMVESWAESYRRDYRHATIITKEVDLTEDGK